MHIHQKGPRLIIAAPPVAHQRDLPSVLENEAADVQRIAEGMFGKLRAALIVHAAAGVGAHGVDPNHPLTEPRLRGDSRDLADADLLAAIGAAERHPEGLFFPDTYYFDVGGSDLAVYRRAYHAMQERLAAAWAARAEGLPYRTPYQALIMASIIEKETGVAGERRLIASVFLNRLRIGMRLQTDPTIIYGLGAGFDGNLRRRDLERDTPYNTYTRAGLTPTPIALPGAAALAAALNPERSPYIYFVARGDGSHEFSAGLTEHNRAVNRFQRRGGK